MENKSIANNAKTTGGVTGKGFRKGTSGNPKGRPRLPSEFVELAKGKSVDALKRLISIAEDENQKTEHVIRACETIIAYGYGKPLQAVDLSNSDKSLNITVSLPKEINEYAE